MRFSEFYAPERQRELLLEAEQRRLARVATANQQSWLISLKKGDRMMYRKMLVALIVVSSLVVGYLVFNGSPAQASHNCGTDGAVLAANPELNTACGYDLVAGQDNGQVAFYAVDTISDSTYLAVNPELKIARRYIAVEASAAGYTGFVRFH